jgi:nicotinate-nucleotide pyrophosphorylase (carboxylating)
MTVPVPTSVQKIVDMALEEDLGRGDITTSLCVPTGAMGLGRVLARQDLVVSGTDVFAMVMDKVDQSIRVSPVASDGDRVKTGDPVLETTGPMASLLMGEPVVHGGGSNHRVDLAGGILIKENHIAAAGSVKEAIARCRRGAPPSLRMEVEVRDEDELRQALEEGIDAVLLDNMDVVDVARCVEIVSGRAVVEASGGVDLQTVGGLAVAGVDVISVGAFTHSAPSADLSFIVEGVRRLS